MWKKKFKTKTARKKIGPTFKMKVCELDNMKKKEDEYYKLSMNNWWFETADLVRNTITRRQGVVVPVAQPITMTYTAQNPGWNVYGTIGADGVFTPTPQPNETLRWGNNDILTVTFDDEVEEGNG